MKKDKKIIVYDENCTGMIPENVVDFMAFWKDKINLIPEEHLKNAKISINPAPLYEDGAELYVMVSYTRPETDAEELIRIEKEHNRQQSTKEQELALLGQLLVKYRNDYTKIFNSKEEK